jgi:hypothetical protein
MLYEAFNLRRAISYYHSHRTSNGLRSLARHSTYHIHYGTVGYKHLPCYVIHRRVEYLRRREKACGDCFAFYCLYSVRNRASPLKTMVLVRAEPTSWADLEALEGFQSFKEKLSARGWDYFLHLLQGHNETVTLKFALGFDGKRAHMGSLVFEVSEQTIARVTRLPRTGKSCSKNSKVSIPDFKPFLKEEYESVSSTKGYPELWIKPEFHKPLAIIQRVIACAGRYSYFQAYHLRILAHFESNLLMNFPYFFYKSLEKMSSLTQKNTINPKASLCHHGLVKLLVMDALNQQGRTWVDYVQEVVQTLEHPPLEDVPSTVRDEEIAPIHDTPTSPNQSPIHSHLDASSPVIPSSDTIIPTPTPMQQSHIRKSMWKTPKRKRGSNRPKEPEEQKAIAPTRRLTRSMLKKPRSLSPHLEDASVEPIDLSTPSPVKEPPEKLAEELPIEQDNVEETNQHVAANAKEDATAVSSPSPFDSHTLHSDPVEESILDNEDLIAKLKEDVKIAEVLERHIKEENATLKERIHVIQDKYDGFKRKYKLLKRELKKKNKQCLELQQQLDSIKSMPSSSSPTKLQVLAATVVSAAGL